MAIDLHSIECKICFLSPPLFPVWFTCFPCRKDITHPNCNSLSRVCMECARKYLESDLKKTQRTNRKRCLHCQAYTNPKLLTINNPGYEKDYLLMKIDTVVKKCVFAEDGCEFMGTQMILLEHVHQICTYRKVSCEGCNSVFRMEELENHKKDCIEYGICPLNCGYILKKKLESHLEAVHQSKACEKCFEVTLIEEFENHQIEHCMHRDIQCSFCDGSYVFSEYAEHYEADIAMLLEKKRNYWTKIRKLYEDMESNNRKISMIESIMGKIYSLDFSPWSNNTDTNFQTPNANRRRHSIENNEDLTNPLRSQEEDDTNSHPIQTLNIINSIIISSDEDSDDEESSSEEEDDEL